MTQNITKTARGMRKKPTVGERLFIERMNGWNIKYQFQFVIGPFIADFYLPEYHLIIEIDGRQHYTEHGARRDARRTTYLENRGFKVLRIPNHLVYKITRNDLSHKISAAFEMKPEDKTFHTAYMASL